MAKTFPTTQKAKSDPNTYSRSIFFQMLTFTKERTWWFILFNFFNHLNFATCLTPNEDYDYKDVIRLSLLFYKAQRSGYQIPDDKISWREDSALEDRGQNGEDLVGGYYDGEFD